ncbi:HAD family hydrolase [Subtercola frigoramans]|uniref:HAD superfamily hydrolase (TIGR01509 family) n=1 Tax=Subtercola frigoramans TaxID=120298 RepID=A0ABS2L741_9MICO|nr:HAD family phosphatase [Subtercola frigoramans]MBM7472291.1 HAD superfamily hydrolase (TIGR01509 family) [Subtercola frigoramans]
MTAQFPAAVLWDMDGTIVDTEPYWMSAQTALIEAHGGSWSHEEAMDLVGSGLWRTAQAMQAHGVSMSEDAIVSLLSERVMEQISASVPWRPGAMELLKALREQGIRTALVTMSIGRMAEHVRAFIPFDAFDVVISGDSVTNAKPHPEAYLAAAEALGVAAGDCVAIEDSTTGVASAAAASVVTIGVPHYLPLDDSPAHVLWPTLLGRRPGDIAEVFALHRETGARASERRHSQSHSTPSQTERPPMTPRFTS